METKFFRNRNMGDNSFSLPMRDGNPPSSSTVGAVPCFSLPMRDGNTQMHAPSVTAFGFSLPMRDGNTYEIWSKQLNEIGF